MTNKSVVIIACLLLAFFLPFISKAQTVTYIGHYTISDHITKDTLIDTVTGVKYILDKKRIYITAMDRNGKQLWKTDPAIDNKLGEYRVKRPVIVFFEFGMDNIKKNQVIKIQYNNTQGGYLDKKTGKFTFEGQD